MFRVPLERQTRSRRFNGSSQYLYTGSVPISAWPVSISVWFRAASVHTGALFSVTDETYTVSGQGGYITAYLISDGKCRIQADSGADGGASFANTSTLYTVGVWHHYLGIISSDTSKEVYLNAGGVGTDTTSESFPAGLDGVSIGVQNVYRYQAGPTNYFSGELGEITIYNVALGSKDIVALANGQSPLSIRREGIVAYYPWFNSAPLTDLKTLRTYTNNGASLAHSSFPPKRTAQSRIILFGASAGSGNQIITPTTGSIIVAGSAPTVKQNILRQPTVGSVVVAGSAPTVKQNILRQPTVGSVVVTGNAPTLVTNTLRQPAAGSVIVAGNAPAVVTGGDKVVNPNTGTIVVSGLAPTLKVNTIRQPTVGSVVVAGAAPTVRQGIVRLPTVGSIVVAGLAPTVSYTSHVVRTPSAGTITVAGNAPEIIGASIWTNVSAASTIWTNASAASTTWTNQ